MVITIWGPGANQTYAQKLKNAIETAWKGSYKDPKTGEAYRVLTKADVSLYDPSRGEGLSAPNGFYVGDDVARSSFNNISKSKPRYPGDPGIYEGSINPNADAERHEGGHVLGQPDDYYEYFNEEHQYVTGPQPGPAGHLMGDKKQLHAAQDEINRIGAFVLGQSRTTAKS